MTEEVKAAVAARVDALADELVALSRDLHAHPETAFAEHRSARRLAEVAGRRGLPVALGTGGLPTAFCGQAGDRGPVVAVLAEYDALPKLGHACGHNVIAAASLGAALALASVAAEAGGRVRLVGTPAEEGLGGGKARLAGAGAFRGVTAALMVHPSGFDVATPNVVAAAGFTVTTHGRAAHASMYPERGVNALDGLVLGYTALAALRAHLPRGDKASAIVRHGGDAPNVVPDRAVAEVLLRSRTLAGLRPLTERALGCFHGGAAAVGARASATPTGAPYAELRGNRPLADAYSANAVALGRRLLAPGSVPETLAGSTDVGNLSHVVPAIQPHIAIAPKGVASHSPEFAEAAASPAADRAVLDGAKAVAMTAVDLWLRADLRAAVRAAFHREGR